MLGSLPEPANSLREVSPDGRAVSRRKNDFPGRAPDEFTTHLGRSMPDSVRGFDIERSENNVDLQEKKPGLDNLQAAADAAPNGRAELSTMNALACIDAGGSRHGSPPGGCRRRAKAASTMPSCTYANLSEPTNFGVTPRTHDGFLFRRSRRLGFDTRKFPRFDRVASCPRGRSFRRPDRQGNSADYAAGRRPPPSGPWRRFRRRRDRRCRLTTATLST